MITLIRGVRHAFRGFWIIKGDRRRFKSSTGSGVDRILQSECSLQTAFLPIQDLLSGWRVYLRWHLHIGPFSASSQVCWQPPLPWLHVTAVTWTKKVLHHGAVLVRVCSAHVVGHVQIQSLWFLASSNPGRHSQATPPLGVSLQMWAQPCSLFIQLRPSEIGRGWEAHNEMLLRWLGGNTQRHTC